MLKCPKCGSEDSGVIDSRGGMNYTVRRRRICNECLYRFSTIEITDGDYTKLKRESGLLRQIADYMNERMDNNAKDS